MIAFSVVGDPIPQPRPRLGKSGHVWTPEACRDWRDLVAWRAKEAGITLISRPCALALHFRLNHGRRTDIDNLAKAVMDALNGIAYEDDSQVCALIVTRARTLPPGCDIIIYDGPEASKLVTEIADWT